MKIWTIIPARGGSKGVPDKNIKLLAGHPLIAYSILCSKMSKMIQRTIVSTDSQVIADIASSYGAEIPFLRPSEFATDLSPDIGFMLHALDFFKDELPDLIVHLRPTTPLREAKHIDFAIERLIKNPYASSLRSAHELSEHPFKMFVKDELYFKPFVNYYFNMESKKEYEVTNAPRQKFEPVYAPNGYVDVLKVSHILKNKELHGQFILPYITPRVIEIDNLEDFEEAELNAPRFAPGIFSSFPHNPESGVA